MAADLVDGLVAGQGQQPGAEGHAAIAAHGGTPYIVEDVDRHFVGNGVRVEAAAAELEPREDTHTWRPCPVQGVECALVARCHGSQQFGRIERECAFTRPSPTRTMS